MHRKDIPVVYEDEHILAVNKPPRIATVPAEGISLRETVLGKVQQQFSGADFAPYLLHRLDLETSGVLLFGKRENERPQLEAIFGDPETRKKYNALVRGVPSGKVITKPLPTRASPEQSIPAQTYYKVIKVFKAPGPLCAFIEAEIKTGRKHQIRKHFMMIGHPIIMDHVYGDTHFNRKFRLRYRLGRQFLHAASLTFFHPFLKKPLTVLAPLAPDLVSVLKKLGS